MNTFILLLSFVAFSIEGLSQTVTPHSVPTEFKSEYYEVIVNGEIVPVFHAGLNVYFAGFDFTGTANISVKSNYDNNSYSGQTSNKEEMKVDEKGYWRGEAFVRPLSKNVLSKLNGSTVTFSLSEAGQYSVERLGTGNFKDDVIFIFANRPDKEIPDFADTNIIHLKAGIHNRHIDLTSGQILYLDAGAVLFGSVNVWDAKNVSILGRGTVVYYGPQSETHDDGWKNQKYWHPLTTKNVEGLTVKGISFIGKSRTWSLQMHSTYDALFDNIKILAVNPQNINGDGMDWYGGGRTIVKNSLIRSMDDCFAFFTKESCEDMWATNRDTEGEVKDILIENCVLWTTLANIFRIGFNGQALRSDNITMKNCDVIHISKGQWYAPWSLLCSVSPNSKGKAKHSNYLMENIRFEEPAALFGLQNPEATYTNIILKNITMKGNPIPSIIKSELINVTFEKVILNGKPLRGDVQIPLQQGSRISKTSYLPK